jgi:rfaE bifunctional protein nucleotidyltransferase chain/domain
MIVLCHGTFDLLHLGHVRMFAEAKRLCGGLATLVVTLTADEYVNKGPGRPIFSEHERAEMIRAVRYVDVVEVIYESSGRKAIEIFRPRFYVKGADYLVADKHGALEAERGLVERYGGELYLASHAGYSSSAIVERIRREVS